MALLYFAMIGLYVAMICFIYGAVTCVPPAGKWPGEIFPPHAAVVACTVNMMAMSFWLTLRFTSANIAVRRLHALEPHRFDD